MEETDDLFEMPTQLLSEIKPKKRGSKLWPRPKLSSKVNIINKTSTSDLRFNQLVRGGRAPQSQGASQARILCRSDVPREALNEEFQILLSPTQSQIVAKLTSPWPPVDKRGTEHVGREGPSEKGKRKSKTISKDGLLSGYSTIEGKKARSKRILVEDNILQESDSDGKHKRRHSKADKSHKEEHIEGEEEEADFLIDADGRQVSLTRTQSGHYIDDSGIPAKLKKTPSGRLVTEDGRRVVFHRKPAQPKGKFYWKTEDGRFIDADGNEGHFHKSPSGRFINEEGRTGRFKRGSDGSYFFQYDKDKSIRRSDDSSRRSSSLGQKERFTKTSSGRFVDHDGKETQGPFHRTSSGSYVDGRGRKGRFRLSSNGFYYFDASDSAALRPKPLGSLIPNSDLYHKTKSGRFVDADGKEGKYRLLPDGRYVDEFGNEVSEEEVLRYYRDGDAPTIDPRAFSLANALYSLSAEPTVPARPRRTSKHHLKSLDRVGEIGPVNFREKKMSISFAKTPKPVATKVHSADRKPQLLRADEIEIFCAETSDLNLSDADSGSILFQIDLEPPPEPKKKKKKLGDPLSRIKGRRLRLPSLFHRTRYIKFKGWDVGFFAKPDPAVRLPDLVDNADALLKYTSRQRKSFVYDESEGTEAHGDTRAQAIQYVAEYGIWELLEFVLFSLAKEKPQNPYDFLIELLRAISRLMNLRSQSYETIQESLLRATQAAHLLDDKKMPRPGITPMASRVPLDVHRDVSLFPSPVPSNVRLSPVLSRNISGVGSASIWRSPTMNPPWEKKEMED